MFPTLFCMAIDYLAIQATLVPSKRMFSSFAETDTKRCNYLSLITFEALQVLKYCYRQDQLDFIQPWVSRESNMFVTNKDGEPAVEALLTSPNSIVWLKSVYETLAQEEDLDDAVNGNESDDNNENNNN